MPNWLRFTNRARSGTCVRCSPIRESGHIIRAPSSCRRGGLSYNNVMICYMVIYRCPTHANMAAGCRQLTHYMRSPQPLTDLTWCKDSMSRLGNSTIATVPHKHTQRRDWAQQAQCPLCACQRRRVVVMYMAVEVCQAVMFTAMV